MPKASKKNEKDDLRIKVDELTQDLQRTRADFENYRKRAEQEREQARESASAATIIKLLPVIDTLDRALAHIPKELEENAWAKGVAGLSKNIDKMLTSLNIERIKASVDTEFDPNLHEAIQMEDGEGEREVITEELQPGYKLNGAVIRHSLVKVIRK